MIPVTVIMDNILYTFLNIHIDPRGEIDFVMRNTENPINLWVIGISHQTAPVHIRERFFLNEPEQRLMLSEFKSQAAVIGALVLSTCNRTEIVADMIDQDPAVIFQVFAKVKGIVIDGGLKKHFYIHKNEKAVDHLLRVAAGLESLILGERQILGQLKAAVELSRREGMASRNLNILSGVAIRAGKKAQTETAISAGGSSVSWAAVAMAQREWGSLKDRSVLIIGTGKMGYLAANYLNKREVGRLYVMNRTPEKAAELARQVGGRAVPSWDLKEVLKDVDVCICAAGAPHHLIEEDLMREVMAARAGRRIVLIDISMPRNIDPGAGSIDNVTLVPIDALEVIVEENGHRRLAAVGEVKAIVAQKGREFWGKVFGNPFAQNAGLPQTLEVG